MRLHTETVDNFPNRVVGVESRCRSPDFPAASLRARPTRHRAFPLFLDTSSCLGLTFPRTGRPVCLVAAFVSSLLKKKHVDNSFCVNNGIVVRLASDNTPPPWSTASMQIMVIVCLVGHRLPF